LPRLLSRHLEEAVVAAEAIDRILEDVDALVGRG
jgi:hypothetical protein